MMPPKNSLTTGCQRMVAGGPIKQATRTSSILTNMHLLLLLLAASCWVLGATDSIDKHSMFEKMKIVESEGSFSASTLLMKKPITGLQLVFVGISVAVGFAAVICAGYWGHSTNSEDGFGGGLNWTDQVFNWHGKDTCLLPYLCCLFLHSFSRMLSPLPALYEVVCMVSFFCCMSMALVSFRALPLGKPLNKGLHIFWHCCALFCLIMGLIAVFKSHNTKEAAGGLKPNLYSIHSWVGLAVTILFGQNYVLGVLLYGTNLVPLSWKQIYMPFHQFFGEVAYFVAVAAIESGIMEKNVFNGCSYSTSGKDYNPAVNYLDIPAGCRLSNGIGILILTLVICVAFVKSDLFLTARKDDDLTSSLLSDGKL